MSKIAACLLFLLAPYLSAGCDYSAVALDFLAMSTEAKSCLLLDEGCGKSDVLFAPRLNPECGIEDEGRQVRISGTFAARWNLLQRTYLDTPINKWKPMAMTDYGYVIFKPDPENPAGSVINYRRFCISYATKMLGVQNIFQPYLSGGVTQTSA